LHSGDSEKVSTLYGREIFELPKLQPVRLAVKSMTHLYKPILVHTLSQLLYLTVLLNVA